ncbi:MAG TPA: proline iminopeptidase-family hydrolase [Actinomycetota bacterium]
MGDTRDRAVPRTEGRIPFRGFETWYRVVGDGEAEGRLPVLCLHGGPGATHHHMEPYEALAGAGRRVVLYDQLGCGRSAIEAPHDASMYTPELFMEEIDAVRDALGLDRIHVLGHSWGGMLGMQYAIGHPPGLAGLIVESSPASIPQWVAEANRLRDELPPEVQAVLLRHEEAGTTDDPEYERAMTVFYDRHVCRVRPYPDWLQATFDGIAANPEVYHHMNGPSEFHVIGTIRDWDITDRLAEITVPTLVLSGRYDEATPAIAETVHRGIPGSEWVMFEQSSHMAQAEEPDEILRVVSEFLDRVESGTGGSS